MTEDDEIIKEIESLRRKLIRLRARYQRLQEEHKKMWDKWAKENMSEQTN